MFCTACGARYASDAIFCVGCGRQFSRSSKAFHSIPVGDLPDVTRSRLLTALKDSPPETIVISESKRFRAIVGVVIATAGGCYVISEANAYKWQPNAMAANLGIVIGACVLGWLAAAYLIRSARSAFKPSVLLNPLYLLKFRLGRIEAITLPLAENCKIKHHSDSHGRYSGTTFSFKADGIERAINIGTIRLANEIVAALNRHPLLVSELVQAQNSTALYSLDLLYEWRHREEAYPRSETLPAGFGFIARRFGPTLLAMIVGILVFFFVLVPYNDACDDNLRWNLANSKGTATAYRLYTASRPDGRHSNSAHEAISALYEKAVTDYKASAGTESQGIEAVIKILEYAKASGHYNVRVIFSDDNEIPADIDARIRYISGLPRVVPVLPSFTTQMNRSREERILDRMKNSFGKVIPGDILQFDMGPSTERDPVFNVSYRIAASGEVYFPEKQQRMPEANRDWYTGISFGWDFNIFVPDSAGSRFQFSLDSRPADLFNVAYQRTDSEGDELSPIEVYGAMADSAFEDFGTKLLAQLSLN